VLLRLVLLLLSTLLLLLLLLLLLRLLFCTLRSRGPATHVVLYSFPLSYMPTCARSKPALISHTQMTLILDATDTKAPFRGGCYTTTTLPTPYLFARTPVSYTHLRAHET